MATALIQWVMRSQPGWIVPLARAAAASAAGLIWVASAVIGGPCTSSYLNLSIRAPFVSPHRPGLVTQLRDGSPTGCAHKGNPLTHPMSKTSAGNFFEDFRVGSLIRHATPRTITVGDVTLYSSLYGPRFAVQSADTFAQAIGYPRAPVDDLLVFHIVFGKSVPDISINAVANLGYAGCRFLAPVYPGDTIGAVSEVIGLKENSNRKTGI